MTSCGPLQQGIIVFIKIERLSLSLNEGSIDAAAIDTPFTRFGLALSKNVKTIVCQQLSCQVHPHQPIKKSHLQTMVLYKLKTIQLNCTCFWSFLRTVPLLLLVCGHFVLSIADAGIARTIFVEYYCCCCWRRQVRNSCWLLLLMVLGRRFTLNIAHAGVR